MPSRGPISLHLDLWRYWNAKRGDRMILARGDLDPADMRHLLPYVTLVDRIDGRSRYRLVGSAACQDQGHDTTGEFVGSRATPPQYAAALIAIYEGVFATGHPHFSTGEYRAPSQAVHRSSRLLLPLGEDGTSVNMVVLTRIARFNRNVSAGTDWVTGAPGKICDIVEVSSFEQLKLLCSAWESQSSRTQGVA